MSEEGLTLARVVTATGLTSFRRKKIHKFAAGSTRDKADDILREQLCVFYVDS